MADATQIHTHMCYAEFGDIMDAVVALDVDVISIEAARVAMDLLGDLAAVDYRAGIGLGVYDIHSPTVPSTEEIAHFIDQALQRPARRPALGQPRLRPEDPAPPEVAAALAHMVAAARRARAGERTPGPEANAATEINRATEIDRRLGRRADWVWTPGIGPLPSSCALNQQVMPTVRGRPPTTGRPPMKLSHIPCASSPAPSSSTPVSTSGRATRTRPTPSTAWPRAPTRCSPPWIPRQFLRLLAAGEIATGAALLAPMVSTAKAGAALTGFSGALLGLYAKTPGMRKPGSIWPTQQGTPISKDSWMLAIGLALIVDGLLDKRGG